MEVGTENWDNYRLYLSVYGRAVSGFGYDGEPPETLGEDVDDGGDNEEDDTAEFVLSEDCGFTIVWLPIACPQFQQMQVSHTLLKIDFSFSYN